MVKPFYYWIVFRVPAGADAMEMVGKCIDGLYCTDAPQSSPDKAEVCRIRLSEDAGAAKFDNAGDCLRAAARQIVESLNAGLSEGDKEVNGRFTVVSGITNPTDGVKTPQEFIQAFASLRCVHIACMRANPYRTNGAQASPI